MSFHWKASSEAGYDFYGLLTNNTLVDFISGEFDWAVQSIPLPPGAQTIRRSYTEDYSASEGMVAAGLDDVSFLQQGYKNAVPHKPDNIANANNSVGGRYDWVVPAGYCNRTFTLDVTNNWNHIAQNKTRG